MLGSDPSYFLELQTRTGWGRMLASFARWCAPPSGSRVLDVGCGPGLLPALFAQMGCQSFGCDLDKDMFADPLHPQLALSDGTHLAFPENTFDLVTASNLLYLSHQPLTILKEMARVTLPGGWVSLLNPSEKMTAKAAEKLADEKALEGLGRDTLLNFAQRAEKHYRWSETKLVEMFDQVGLQFRETTLRMGSGLIRYAKAVKTVE